MAGVKARRGYSIAKEARQEAAGRHPKVDAGRRPRLRTVAIWTRLGWPAFIAVLAIYALMVGKV